ncbi:Alkaline phosphatase [hydrothermal vent metagenome]|uniref:Alkaline phosphatase n=1 Tax=hydrothermal vent metagenome TaxID=652676 RepID=A0A3B0XRM3_9ZZZZ
MISKIIFIALTFLLSSCSYKAAVQGDLTENHEIIWSGKPVKNIILMIGDGMGAEHRRVARLIHKGESAELAMDRLAVKGQVRTSAFNGVLTDSAAAATAMATGQKTANGVIGLSPQLNHLENIIQAAQSRGKATGLVTTTQITHATPAAFVAHTGSRKNMSEIARQIGSSEVDVLMGGGEIYFLPDGDKGCFEKKGVRKDKLNLIKMLQSSGYTYVCNQAALEKLNARSPQRLLGLFAPEDLKRPFSPELALMTRKSIELLSQNPNGFFLMVEGGQIDWASHGNESENVMQSLQGFDQAVEIAWDFVSSRDDTLLIVTADHETGGLQVNKQAGHEGPFISSSGQGFFIDWTTHDHTAVNVPLTADGPMSELLRGEIDNTYIYQVMLKAVESTESN